jgi:hypothetical protein
VPEKIRTGVRYEAASLGRSYSVRALEPIALFKAPNAENWIVILWQDRASYGQTNANDRLAI